MDLRWSNGKASGDFDTASHTRGERLDSETKANRLVIAIDVNMIRMVEVMLNAKQMQRCPTYAIPKSEFRDAESKALSHLDAVPGIEIMGQGFRN